MLVCHKKDVVSLGGLVNFFFEATVQESSANPLTCRGVVADANGRDSIKEEWG
jgi:hypothetical protein